MPFVTNSPQPGHLRPGQEIIAPVQTAKQPIIMTVAYHGRSCANSALFNLKDAPPVMCFVEFLGKSCFLLRAAYKIVRFCVSLNGKSQFLDLLRRFEKSFPVMVITRQQQDVVPSATG